jgi:ABC-type transport system involved in multi-copper enzyme maturation permease subunit
MNTASAFKAIVWKELRANWRWAIAGMGVLLIDLLYQMSNSIRNIDLDGIWSAIHSSLAIFAPLIALLIGVLQIAPEQSRDRWAFFLHRPVKPSLLLLGKVTVGLSLYLAATLVPFFSVAWWLAIPGHVAGPFDSEALLPGLTDIFVGIPFYFAAMLCLIRKARWYGTKFLRYGAQYASLCFGLASCCLSRCIRGLRWAGVHRAVKRDF